MIINNEFIKQHDRLVRVIVNQYQTKGIKKQDLMQEGYLGLIEAAKRFDPNRGIQFASYASWWIRKYITMALQEYGNTIHLPQHAPDAMEMCISMSFDDILYVEDGDPITFADTITDGESVETLFIQKEDRACVRGHLLNLSSREQQIVEGLYGLKNQPLTTEELAKQMGTSPNRIRRVHERAIHKVRHSLTN